MKFMNQWYSQNTEENITSAYAATVTMVMSGPELLPRVTSGSVFLLYLWSVLKPMVSITIGNHACWSPRTLPSWACTSLFLRWLALALSGHCSGKAGPALYGRACPCTYKRCPHPSLRSWENWPWCHGPRRAGSFHNWGGTPSGPDLSPQLSPRPTSWVLSWPTLTYTPPVTCWNVGRNWPYGKKTAGSPWIRATEGYFSVGDGLVMMVFQRL